MASASLPPPKRGIHPQSVGRAVTGGFARGSLAIESLAFGGAGVGRRDGKVVFVPGALPGETVSVRPEREHPSYLQARLVDVKAAAPERIAPSCPLALRAEEDAAAPAMACPGCAYQHLRPEAELAAKAGQLRELIARVGKLAVPEAAWADPVPSPASLGYRNKLTLHAARTDDGRPVLGYFGEDNRSVLDVPHCPLAHPQIGARLEELRADPAFRRRLHPGRTWTFRRTERDGVVCWAGQAQRNDSWLREATPHGEVAVPRGGFFQVNPAVGAALARTVEAILREHAPARLVDLYCGCGVFALAAAAAGVGEICGIDSDRGAIAAARENVRAHGRPDIPFQAATAEEALAKTLAAHPRAALIIDPPRSGLSPAVRKAIAAAAPPLLLYVSCAPDTLARDLRDLVAHGHAVHRLQAFDMFPRTAHFETLAVLVR